MANDNDFLKIMVRDVSMHWPRLDQPYRYNNSEKRTEPCAPTVTGAGYSITWKCSKDEGKSLHGALRDHYNACRTRNPKLPEFSGVFGMKRDDQAGTVRFTAKRTAVANDGKVKKPPRVVGPDLKDLEGEAAAIWSGSKGDIRVYAFPVTDPEGKGGISITFDVVQVKEAVYGGSLEDDFSATPAAKTMDEDFGEARAENNRPAPQSQPKVALEDAEW